MNHRRRLECDAREFATNVSIMSKAPTVHVLAGDGVEGKEICLPPKPVVMNPPTSPIKPTEDEAHEDIEPELGPTNDSPAPKKPTQV